MKADGEFEIREELYDFVYRSVFTSVIAVFMFLEIYYAVDSKVITSGNIIAVIITGISFNALLLLYRRVKLYLLPAVAVVAVILYFTVDKEDISLILESVTFSLVLISLAAFILFLICDRVMLLNIILAGGVLIYMICELFFGYYMHRASPTFGFIYIFAAWMRFLRDGVKTGDRTRTRRYITFLLPFIAALFLILVILPKPNKPISWKWVGDLYEYASEKINVLAHRISTKYGRNVSDSFKITFGMDERMTYDNSRDSASELFEVTPDGPVFGYLYMKGEIYNEFKDGQWYNTLPGDKDYSFMDALETRLGVARAKGTIDTSLLKDTTINVKVLDVVTPIVFSPSKLTAFTNVSADKNVTGVNEHLLFSKNAPYAGEYKVSYVQLNIGNTIFSEYLNSSADPAVADEAEAFDFIRREYRRDYKDVTYEDLLSYREYVKRSFSSTPVIRDSVKEWLESVFEAALASKISEGATGEDGTAGNTVGNTAGQRAELSDYEKLSALEQALAGFKYDLNSSSLPSYVKTEGDFINYFILEKREGYCVHYATVFCLLARYLGYESRVVQGFKEQTPGNVATRILEGCGHAWPEVYFEGKGWIPFEPTPGMDGERYGGWAVKSGRLRNSESERYRGNKDETPLPDEDPEYEQEHRESFASGILIFAIAGIVIISLLLLLVASYLLRRRKLKRMNVQERYFHEYEIILRILAQFGIRRELSETLSEFAMRADETLGIGAGAEGPDRSILKDTGLKSFMETYEACLYGGKEPDSSDTEILRKCRDELDMLMKKHFGKTYRIRRFLIAVR